MLFCLFCFLLLCFVMFCFINEWFVQGWAVALLVTDCVEMIVLVFGCLIFSFADFVSVFLFLSSSPLDSFIC